MSDYDFFVIRQSETAGDFARGAIPGRAITLARLRDLSARPGSAGTFMARHRTSGAVYICSVQGDCVWLVAQVLV